MTKEVGFFVHQMLEASYQFIPEAADTERYRFLASTHFISLFADSYD